MKKITEKFFEPLSMANANMIPVIIDRLGLFGITIDELEEMYKEYIAERRAEIQAKAEEIKTGIDASILAAKAVPVATVKPASNSLFCPVCGAPVKKLRVNISKCTRVSGNYKFAFMCTNLNCSHVKYK